ncbi:HAMP domain-containing protein [Actinoplanes sp. NPDC051513]|uniref:HAMP domain-containing protein n=1 Tax=Actinoplanes sp. NPDC051513 TaxID=3363908 RepID=UPI00378F694E
MPEALPRVFRPRTIRVQLTLAITAVVALVVALAGLAVVLYADHRDLKDVDDTLAARAAVVRTAAAKSGSLPTDGTYVVRLVQGTDVRAEAGSSTKFSIPVKDGYSTVTAEDGSHWRSWAEKLKTGVQLQILIDLQDVETRHSRNVRMIDLIVLLAAVVAAAGTWVVGGLVLRPLLKLAEGAKAVTPDDPTVRLPVVTSPPEVAELGKAINTAIDRYAGTDTPAPKSVAAPESEAALSRQAEELAQQIAAEITKVTADLRAPLAELGEGLDQLLDNPDMPATQRHLYLASIQTEYRRIVTLVDDLETRATSR